MQGHAQNGGVNSANPAPQGANLPVLRHHNTALVLGLLRAATVGGGPGVGRPELAERTCRTMIETYDGFGYDLVEVPRAPVVARLSFVLERIEAA